MKRFHSRREALILGAASVTAAFAAPMVRSAQNSLPRVAFIGTGGQGKSNMGALMKLTNPVAVCDVDSTRLAEAAAMVEKARPGVFADKDYRKILDRKDIDAVVITTPDHWHARMTIDACAAGKDVYCEKPLSLTVAEGRSMVTAARKYGRIVQTGSQQRSAANFRDTCERVRNGLLGKISTVEVGIPGVNFKGPPVADGMPPAELDYDLWLGPAPMRPYNLKRVHYNFRFFWDYSGGQMTNFGAHHLDIAQWGLGRDNSGPSHVKGTFEYHPMKWFEVPMKARIEYRYDDGVTMILAQGDDAIRQGTKFIGERGWIYVTRGKTEASDPALLKAALPSGATRLISSSNHHKNWLDCIQSREKPICDVEIGHRSATVCHLGNIAARVGRAIAWDPVKETIPGDAEAAKMLSRPYRAPWQAPLA